ncbi:Uncharacterized conserved protein, Ntn-hydrolase superfamily [Tistlia consotensis]|uniref:Uncharacterized conserved protein, Ntn-hydrolase superfamily n=1 Tax=Tistlia consotensis USBA 355 TaxID=560819 RepID=A0A1Y6CRF5_9PROT|nr:DUF1028 domain-containing protein [Tistlia consotensis]SMF82827.1 Uncharacterized conserved protein, Ntn-hydrolase superfamily [Tistlia consotensis USBA 355]SNS30941.1 Uncharacterized conserved protein, Ntn-hydrolase superfamily [Tistlia consotensis]
MTFSLTARCARTGQLGVAVTSSSIAVAARCTFVRAGTGAVATQNVTDPRLGPKGLDFLAAGLPAQAAMNALLATQAHPEYRQVALIDDQGAIAWHSGARALGLAAVVVGPDCVAAGNLLADEGVPAAMVRAFEESGGELLAERLVRALEAGLAAGGEAGPVHSAGLVVAAEEAWPWADLRVDWHDEPNGAIPALRRLWQDWAPQADAYVTRALDPTAAPSYGVPGDE